MPHTEVELILVNCESVGFEHRLRDGDRVSVYPMFEALRRHAAAARAPAAAARAARFIADAQLGGLARLLRMLGFDTLYDRQLARRRASSARVARGPHRS